MWKILHIQGQQNFDRIYLRLMKAQLECQVFSHPGAIFELHYKRPVGRPQFRQVC